MLDEIYKTAANPETSPEILRELSQHELMEIRRAVALNPNIPIEVLWELLKDFPHEAIANPIFILVTLENPNWINNLSERIFLNLLYRPGIPDIFIQKSIHSKYERIRQISAKMILANPDTSSQRLEELILTHNILYANAVNHPNFTHELLLKCLERCDTIL